MENDGSLIVKGMRIHPDVLRRRAVQCCADGNCDAVCCSGGVWLKENETPRIQAWAGAIKACLPAERHDESKWFETADDEVGTTTVDDPLRPGQECCIFLQPDRKCALQVVSEANHLGWPGIKPYYCAIFPLYFDGAVLSMDDVDDEDAEHAACRTSAPTVRAMYELYREEAILVLGEDGYRELHEQAAKMPPNGQNPK